MENEVRYLYLDDIIPNRFQPRENFNEQALKELAVSIREHGVIQPIIVRQIGEKYEIIAGERRYKASTMAGLTKIPAIIKNLDDKESSKVALIENLQRKDLTPIEEARTYQKILELDALTQEELAKTMGKSQSAVSNKLRLLSLTDEVQDALLHEQISERHARSLLSVEDQKKQVDLLNKVIASRMTVRELDEEIKNINGNGSSEPQKARSYQQETPLHEQGSNTTFGISNLENPTVADIDKIKSESVDIIKPTQTVANIESLLMPNNNIAEKAPVDSNNIFVPEQRQEEEIIGGSGLLAGMTIENSNKPNNLENDISASKSLITPINNGVFGENNDKDRISSELNNISNKNEFIQLDVPNINNSLLSNINSDKQNSNQSISNMINTVKNTINNIKSSGQKVDVEEFDFDEFYQFVIRINKS